MLLKNFVINGLRNPLVLNTTTANKWQIFTTTRYLSTELAAALRPFYFAVHPDLFGQYPEQRAVNEDSLKQLSAHMQILYDRKYHVLREKKVLQFYIREENVEERNKFKLIKITLDNRSNDPKKIIQELLELCNLSTDYIKNVKITSIKENAKTNYEGGTMGFKPAQDYNYGAEFSGFEYAFYKAKEENKKTLDTWITENAGLASTRSKELVALKAEVLNLQKNVIKNLGLKDVRYDCGWNFEHYRGCLKTLERLASMHEEPIKNLKGRVVVFAPFTGISLEGHVMLFTGDVLNNWIEFLKNIPQHDSFLKKIPIYENTLSQVLRQIKIGRRKFMPKQQAIEYAGHLMKVTTTLGDYLTVQKFPKSWPNSLQDYEIVIESEAGPLMVSPTGQLIAPATCPGFMLVDFITTNLTVAKERTKKYQEEKHIERSLTEQCLKDLQLKSLTKDDSVTPEKMIESLTALLKYNSKSFHGLELHITNYYSVLTDGIVCIPWDFDKR